jgi:hypothetical protein
MISNTAKVLFSPEKENDCENYSFVLAWQVHSILLIAIDNVKTKITETIEFDLMSKFHQFLLK